MCLCAQIRIFAVSSQEIGPSFFRGHQMKIFSNWPRSTGGACIDLFIHGVGLLLNLGCARKGDSVQEAYGAGLLSSFELTYSLTDMPQSFLWILSKWEPIHAQSLITSQFILAEVSSR
jgi:hypothetical protein